MLSYPNLHANNPQGVDMRSLLISTDIPTRIVVQQPAASTAAHSRPYQAYLPSILALDFNLFTIVVVVVFVHE
jgi:hypothetical protein